MGKRAGESDRERNSACFAQRWVGVACRAETIVLRCGSWEGGSERSRQRSMVTRSKTEANDVGAVCTAALLSNHCAGGLQRLEKEMVARWQAGKVCAKDLSSASIVTFRRMGPAGACTPPPSQWTEFDRSNNSREAGHKHFAYARVCAMSQTLSRTLLRRVRVHTADQRVRDGEVAVAQQARGRPPRRADQGRLYALGEQRGAPAEGARCRAAAPAAAVTATMLQEYRQDQTHSLRVDVPRPPGYPRLGHCELWGEI